MELSQEEITLLLHGLRALNARGQELEGSAKIIALAQRLSQQLEDGQGEPIENGRIKEALTNEPD